MDPNETFRLFVNAMCYDDRETAIHALTDLESHMSGGGFSPTFLCSNNVANRDKTPVPLAFIRNMLDALRSFSEAIL